MVGGIFWNLEEAFDCVNHKILLSKLEFYSIKGKAKLRFESYFRNRYQRVLIANNVLNRNYFSKWEEIKHGVPQGSILGPLLFLFYINDVPKAINNKFIPILFADDTSILITSPNTNDFQIKITANFNFINEWLNTNLLSINFNKTHYIQFTTKNKPKTLLKLLMVINKSQQYQTSNFLESILKIQQTGNTILITFFQNEEWFVMQ
jgi:hypothetical protein